MRLLFFAGLLTLALAAYEFINPPPAALGVFTNLPKYEVGTVVNVVWERGPPQDVTSLTLWQLNAHTGEFFGDLEYVNLRGVNSSSFPWLVGTSKNLAESNLFFLCIFIDGKTSAESNSHYFNITLPHSTSSTSTQSSTTSTSSSSSTSTSSESSTTGTTSTKSTSSSSTTGVPAAATTDPTSSGSGGLSTGAKIGIGVAIPLAVILGACAVAGFMMYRKMRAAQAAAAAAAAPPTYHGGYPPSEMWGPGSGAGSQWGGPPTAAAQWGGQATAVGWNPVGKTELPIDLRPSELDGGPGR